VRIPALWALKGAGMEVALRRDILVEIHKAVEVVTRSAVAAGAAVIAALARAAGHVGAAAIGTARVGGIRRWPGGSAPIGAAAEGRRGIVSWGGHDRAAGIAAIGTTVEARLGMRCAAAMGGATTGWTPMWRLGR